MLGLGLLWQAALGGGGANPLAAIQAMFAGGEKGLIFDAAGVGAAKQELTGGGATTPSGDGDPVGSFRDYSPNNAWLTAPTNGARPTLNQSGALWYLLGDGTDDFLATVAQTIASASLYTAVAFRPGAVSVYERLVSCAAPGASDTDGYAHAATIIRQGGGTTWESYRAGDRAGATVAAATDTVIESGNSATGSYFCVNGGSDVTTSYAAGADFLISRIRLFTSANDSPAAAEYSHARLYAGVVMDRLPTAGERATIRAWLGTKAGLTIP